MDFTICGQNYGSGFIHAVRLVLRISFASAEGGIFHGKIRKIIQNELFGEDQPFPAVTSNA